MTQIVDRSRASSVHQYSNVIVFGAFDVIEPKTFRNALDISATAFPTFTMPLSDRIDKLVSPSD